jgi:DNA/RNA-binding domain of Phe-tRNA-synthetase-like protein
VIASVRLERESDLAAIVTPAVLAFEGVTVIAHDPRMDGPIAATCEKLRAAADLEAPIAAVRAMYRGLGIDPTKTRPSSEALLRRLRKGDALPRINSLVDICNWCSVETQLPFGLYDYDKIEGDAVSLRTGAAGEGYDGIRKDRVNVDGRLTLADSRGPFGNPTSDSARTMVTLETTRVLFVVYCPREHERQGLAAAMDLTARRMLEFTGAAPSLRLTL